MQMDVQWNGYRQLKSYDGSASGTSASAVAAAPFSVGMLIVFNTHGSQDLWLRIGGGDAATDDTDRLEIPPASGPVPIPVHVDKGAAITVAASGAATTWKMILLGGE